MLRSCYLLSNRLLRGCYLLSNRLLRGCYLLSNRLLRGRLRGRLRGCLHSYLDLILGIRIRISIILRIRTTPVPRWQVSSGLVVALARDAHPLEVRPPVADEDLVARGDVRVGLEELDKALTVHASLHGDVGLAVMVQEPRDVPEPAGGADGVDGIDGIEKEDVPVAPRERLEVGDQLA